MKTFKRAISCFLALLMIFGSFSVLSYADFGDGSENTAMFETKFFVDGVETDTVKPGDKVQARVYLTTDYLMGISDIFWVYNKEFMTFDPTGLIEKDGYYVAADVINPNAGLNYDGIFVHSDIVEPYSLADDLIYEEYLTEEFFDDKGWFTIRLNAGNPRIHDGSEYIFAINFIVNEDAEGEGFLYVPEGSTLNPTTRPYGLTCVQEAESATSFEVAAEDFAYNREYEIIFNDRSTIKIGEAAPATYEVKYVYAGDVPAGYTAPETVELEEGATIEIPEITVPAGYTVEWTVAGDVNGKVGTAPVTVTATWAKIVSNENTATFVTKFFVDGVETDTVKPGDKVQARVYLTTDYLMGISDIFWVYSKEFMTFDPTGLIEKDGYYVAADVVNPDAGLNYDGIFVHSDVVEPYSLADDLIYEEYLTEEFFDDKGWFTIRLNAGNPKVHDGSEYVFAINFIVNEDAEGEGFLYVPEGSTLNPTTRPYGLTCVQRAESATSFEVTADDFAYNREYEIIFNDRNTIKLAEVVAPATYEVKYVYAGEVPTGYDAPEAVELEEGATIVIPEITAPAGYTLTWATAGDVDGKVGTAPVTVTGTWAKINYDVIYAFDGVEAPEGIEVPEAATATIGDAIVIPEIAAPAGYKVEWTVAGDVDGKMGTETVTVTYTWSKENYDVIYKFDGETPEGIEVPEATTATIGDAIVIPAIEAPEGYEVVWTMTGDVDGAMGTAPVTVTGTWARKTVTINFAFIGDVPENAEPIAPMTAKYGDSIQNVFNIDDLYDTPDGYGMTVFGIDGAIYNEGTYTAGTEDITVTYIWVLLRCNVEYAYTGDVPAGFEGKNEYPDCFSTFTLETPVAEGYTFNGWTVEGAANYDAATGLVSVGSSYNIKVTGNWTVNEYTITFDADGGSEVAPITQAYGTAIVAPAAPTKTGYTFAGWEPALPETMPVDGLTVKAQWTANEYTITYYLTEEDKAAGIADYVATYSYGQAVEAYEPEVEGKIFVDWDDDHPATMPANNLEYVAIFEDIIYIVTFTNVWGDEITVDKEYGSSLTWDDVPDLPDGEYVEYELTVDGEPLVLPYELTGDLVVDSYFYVVITIYEDEDYETVYETLTFDYGYEITEEDLADLGTPEKKKGYYVDSEMPFDFDILGEAYSSAEVAFVWYPGTYEATFMANGEVYDVVEATFDEEIELPETDPAKTGYTFIGWALAEDGTPVDEFVMTEEGMTFYAVFVENGKASYTVKIFLMDENGDYGEPELVTGLATIDTTVTVAHADYAQDEWFSADEAEANEYSAVVAEDGSTTLKLYYKRAQYTVAVDSVGATEVYHGATITAPSEIANVPEGYYLASWNDGAYAPGAEIVVTSDLTLVPTFAAGTSEYVIKTYTMNLDGTYGEAAVETKTATTDTTVTYTAPAIEGFTADAESYSTLVRGDGKAEINVYYARNKYDLTIDGTTTKAYYGAVIVAPAEPTKEGHTFAGWDKEIPATMPAEDLVITASWTINQYTITFNTDGGSAIDAITQDYATAVTAPEAPTKVGYTFAGWDKEIPATMPAEDLVITASWTINEYTITFDVDGGSAIEAITQAYGTDVTAPAAPTKEGYTFAGWDKEIPATMPAENVTITASWTINQYTITFDVAGGSAVDAITQDYATAVTAPEAPTKTGYTFAGWDKVIPATMPAENVTITAIWTINEYTITFDVDGGSAVDAITQAYGTDVAAPAAPTKEGYTFAGWDKEIPATMPAENVTITAIWTINSYVVEFLNAEGAVHDSSTLEFGATIAAPATEPTKEYYVFAGWSFTEITENLMPEDIADVDLINFETAAPTVPAEDLVIYPVFVRVPVALKALSTAKVIATEDDGDVLVGYIAGLETRLLEEDLLDKYITVEGDGSIEVELTQFGVCGTGTEVRIIDNVTEETVAIYYIVIYGDVNGDADIDASDVSMINAEAIGATSWSADPDLVENNESYDYSKVLAADANGDGFINSLDASLLANVTLFLAEIDQQTGAYIKY